MTKIKGGTPVVRQNFSMHPNLVRVFLDTAPKLTSERAELIVSDRSKRVTYSKIAAAIAWHIKRTMLGHGNELTDEFRQMVADYEASPYEHTKPFPIEDFKKGILAAPAPTHAVTRAPSINTEVLENDDEDGHELWSPGATS